MALRDQVMRGAIVALLAVTCYRAATEPCTSAEGAAYTRYASHTLLEMWNAPFDSHIGLVYGALARVAVRVAGVSELTVRVPAILGGLLFWIALSRLTRRRLKGWRAIAAFAIVTANPWALHFFASASGRALAIGLLSTAACLGASNVYRASILVGLAVGSDPVVSIPVLIAASLTMICLGVDTWKAIDNVLLPGLLTGLFLLLPALLIRQKPAPAASDDLGMRALMQTLMRQPRLAGTTPVAASPSVEPGVSFYRRRYHLNWIQVGSLASKSAYYFLTPAERPLEHKLRLIEVQRAPGVLLDRTAVQP